VLQVGDDLRETEHAHRDADEPDAVRQLRHVERIARDARIDVGADAQQVGRVIAPVSEPDASTTAPTRPTIISAKYSAGPNLNASSTIGPASAARINVPIVPAKKDPIAAVASAAPARPRRAIW
jgi:hypothetical protein